MKKLYFITHPNVVIDPAVPAPRWPLSELGKERMRMLLAQPWVSNIGSLYCSMEQKAIDGAEILASELSLEYTMMATLDEIDRSATGYLPFDEFMGVYAEFLANPTMSVKGWEVAVDAQKRIVGAVSNANDVEGDIAIVAHGVIGVLYLCHLKQCKISLDDEQPGTGGGNYFCVDVESRKLIHDWLPIDHVASKK